jgi:transcriptional regulator with XRE-family HTH domain
VSSEDSGISTRLKAARERRGWSREELAFYAELSWSAIAQIESGRRQNLRPRTLTALASALEISCDYLITGRPSSPMLTHRALLYRDEDEFGDAAERFLRDGMERSEPALVFTDKPKLKLLRKRLGSQADRVELVDSEQVLANPQAAVRFLFELIKRKIKPKAVWVRIVGEPTWAGSSPDEVRLCTKHESLINLLFAGSPLSVLCPYDVGALDPEVVKHIDATHPEAIRGGELVENPDYRDPASFVLEL